ncbi:MAG: hypothetical protein HYZ92_05155 [Candidatus Omnitrophica bacterium]|nr:hypothetical protein [Candidatus Omnitrophota bacterium]
MTLIEVLISVVILAVGSVVIMEAFGRMAQALAVADDETGAYLFAMEKMAQVELEFRQGRLPEDDKESGSFRLGDQGFDWTLRMSAVSEEPPVRSVALDVEWQRGAADYSRHLETVLRVAQPEKGT